jgi:hypothetical protein
MSALVPVTKRAIKKVKKANLQNPSNNQRYTNNISTIALAAFSKKTKKAISNPITQSTRKDTRHSTRSMRTNAKI